MATTGFKLPTTDTAVSGSWTNPTNVQADDGAVASVLPGKNVTVARDAGGFGLVVPAGSIINQVNLRVEWRVSVNTSIATLRINGKVSSTILANHDNAAEPTTLTVETFDITADRAWGVADFADGTFFIRFQAVQGNSSTAVTFEYDRVEAEVVYTEVAAATKMAHYRRRRN